MKILLVIPPAPFLIDDKSLPFLGILSIATVLRSNNIPIELLDLSGMKDYVEVLKNNITNNSYDVIGFTVNTPQLPYVINMLEVIPSHIKKIAGGPHITSCYSAIKHVQNERICKNIKDLEDRFDHLFVGDGEISMLEFLSGNFRGFVKSELFTDEQAKLMKECGFEWLLCGFESADNKILTSINKKATINDNDKMLGLCKKHDIKIKALMSCGHPGESEKSILNIQDWLLSRKVDDFDLTIITPYPGSPYFDFSTHIENDIWKYTSPYTKDSMYSINIDYTKTPHYYKGIPGNYTSYVYTDNIKPEDLSRLRDEVEHNVRKKLYNK